MIVVQLQNIYWISTEYLENIYSSTVQLSPVCGNTPVGPDAWTVDTHFPSRKPFLRHHYHHNHPPHWLILLTDRIKPLIFTEDSEALAHSYSGPPSPCCPRCRGRSRRGWRGPARRSPGWRRCCRRRLRRIWPGTWGGGSASLFCPDIWSNCPPSALHLLPWLDIVICYLRVIG